MEDYLELFSKVGSSLLPPRLQFDFSLLPNHLAKFPAASLQRAFLLHSLSLSDSTMAISETRSPSSLIPSFLYSASSSNATRREKMLCSSPCVSPSPPYPIVEAASPSSRKTFAIPSPSEPRKKIEMYSPAFYAACAIGGSLSCGLTHTAVTPLDLVKCNMQVRTGF